MPQTSFNGQGIISENSLTLLTTAHVDVLDNLGNYHTYRCLLDSGSMSSFITEKAANVLELPKAAYSLDIKGLGSMSSSFDTARINFACKPVYQLDPILYVDVIIVNKNCDQLPGFPISTKGPRDI